MPVHTWCDRDDCGSPFRGQRHLHGAPPYLDQGIAEGPNMGEIEQEIIRGLVFEHGLLIRIATDEDCDLDRRVETTGRATRIMDIVCRIADGRITIQEA